MNEIEKKMNKIQKYSGAVNEKFYQDDFTDPQQQQQ